jgi:hypothetical protein
MITDLSDILASCLESMEQGACSVDEILALYPEYRDELEPLLATVTTIQTRADFTTRPGFQQAGRARLLKRLFPRQPAGFWQSMPGFGAVFSRKLAVSAWSIVFALVVSLVSGGTVYASGRALPGDFLFPVKLYVEDARLFLSDDSGDVKLAAEFLQTRMDEIHYLLEANRAEDLGLAVAAFSDKLSSAEKSLTMTAHNDNQRAAEQAVLFEQALSAHAGVLTTLLDTVPEEARPAIQHALDNTNRGRGVVQDLFPDGLPGGTPPQGAPAQGAPDKTPDPAATLPGNRPDDVPRPVTTPPAGGPPEASPGTDETTPAPGGPPSWALTKIPNQPGNRP